MACASAAGSSVSAAAFERARKDAARRIPASRRREQPVVEVVADVAARVVGWRARCPSRWNKRWRRRRAGEQRIVAASFCRRARRRPAASGGSRSRGCVPSLDADVRRRLGEPERRSRRRGCSPRTSRPRPPYRHRQRRGRRRSTRASEPTPCSAWATSVDGSTHGAEGREAVTRTLIRRTYQERCACVTDDRTSRPGSRVIASREWPLPNHAPRRGVALSGAARLGARARCRARRKLRAPDCCRR